MNDSNMDDMEPTGSTKDLEEKLPIVEEETTFDFDGLPWVIQKRFAEICDPSTLKTFAEINTSTRSLSKRCHLISTAEIDMDDSTCIYTVFCNCNENEHCNGVNLSSSKGKIPVMNALQITNWKEVTHAHVLQTLLQTLPVTFDSIKFLDLCIRCMSLDELKKMINPGLKHLDFYGGIQLGCSLDELSHFIKSLSNLDSFHFSLNYFYSFSLFDIGGFIECCRTLESQKFIDHYFAGRDGYVHFSNKW